MPPSVNPSPTPSIRPRPGVFRRACPEPLEGFPTRSRRPAPVRGEPGRRPRRPVSNHSPLSSRGPPRDLALLFILPRSPEESGLQPSPAARVEPLPPSSRGPPRDLAFAHLLLRSREDSGLQPSPAARVEPLPPVHPEVARGKYRHLYAYLCSLQKHEWRATFRDIESILGFPLPAPRLRPSLPSLVG